ncbi:MAG: TspO/MBR family protein [Thermoanaerobaculia bacterium]|nr:TspO/MBR family protein [Thermoanaerobaculia bacterium]
MKTRDWLALAGWLFVSFSAAIIGGTATASSVATWYPTIAKPAWTPPSWLFGPVWTTLYAMMGFAAWLVWRKAGWRDGAVPLGLFLTQLVLNAAWSLLFFGLRNPFAGLIDIAALWIAIGLTTVAFFRISRIAGWLMIPYWLWVSFATALNFAIWQLNRV